jgi:hypothetical protein
MTASVPLLKERYSSKLIISLRAVHLTGDLRRARFGLPFQSSHNLGHIIAHLAANDRRWKEHAAVDVGGVSDYRGFAAVDRLQLPETVDFLESPADAMPFQCFVRILFDFEPVRKGAGQPRGTHDMVHDLYRAVVLDNLALFEVLKYVRGVCIVGQHVPDALRTTFNDDLGDLELSVINDFVVDRDGGAAVMHLRIGHSGLGTNSGGQNTRTEHESE